MIQKDYIMREVQKMVQVIQVIIGLKQKEKLGQARDEIDNAYARFFDENLKTIQAKNEEEIAQLCIKDGQFSSDLAFALADIIREEAEILEMQGDKKAARRQYQSSLKLYRRAVSEKDAAVPIDIMNKIKQLEKNLNRDR